MQNNILRDIFRAGEYMLIREEIEKKEFDTLSKYAAHSACSEGRVITEEPCDIRTCYQRDRDRILHSKAFRRLKDKTQVFLSPQGDHYRTRLMHTLEVSQIARTIAKALMLNEDLVEAIALGHDIGHTPFGHAGERALNSLCDSGFKHSQQSIRVVERLERDGKGLNLCREVKDGILNHGLSSSPSTLEGQVVRLADKFAYIHHDMDDGIRAGILHEEDVPRNIRASLGYSVKARLDTMVHDVIMNSRDRDVIRMSLENETAMIGLRKFMFENLYTNPVAKKEEKKAFTLLKQLFDYYRENPEKLTGEYLRAVRSGENPEEVICDYISGMTDQYCISKFNEYFVPKSWEKY